MSGKPGIQFPAHAAISADPQTRWIGTRVDSPWLIGPARLNHPDVLEFFTAILRKLDALLRLMPCLAKVIAVAQERAKEVPILGCKQPVAIALIEDGMVNATPSQSRTFDIPVLSIFRAQKKQPSLGSN